MVHQPSGGFQGQATDIMLHAQEILNLKKRLNEIYVKHTGQQLKKIEDALERDTFLTAEGAKEFGIDRQGDRKAAGGTARRRPEAEPSAPDRADCGPFVRGAAIWGASVPFRCRNRHGNSGSGCVRGHQKWSGLPRTARERIVNEFLIVRPLPCFASIERNVCFVRKGMLVPGRV